MKIRQLRTFAEIVRQKSFTRAAAKLRIAQPAVSMAIRKLEEELDLTLFNRQKVGNATITRREGGSCTGLRELKTGSVFLIPPDRVIRGSDRMQPIQELLHRIQWDRAFAKADFEIGYYDRVGERIVRVPFSALHFPEDDRFVFELYGSGGEVRRVPFHRVREVYRDGRCIWRREVE